jgi:hypothetical protein
MGGQRLNLVAPGGGRLTVDLPADPLVSSVVASVRFAGGSYGTGFQIGPRGYHDFASTHVAPSTQTARLLVHGREVMVAEAVDGRSSMATLIGDYHELMTVYAGPAPQRDRILALFASLHVVDQVAGMVVQPVSATLLDLMSEHVVVVVRGRGSLSIPGPRQSLGLVPPHAGARTKHGEVWKAPYPGAEGSAQAADHSFVLGCAAGMAEIHLSGAGEATESDLFGWLDEIDVAWQAG